MYSKCKICGGPIVPKSHSDLPLVYCTSCGLLFADIPPSPGDNYADYGEFMDTYYTEIDTNKGKFTYGLELLNTQKKLTGYSLLDVGCGDGWFIEFCQEKGIKAVGYDLSLAVADYAYKKRGVKVYTDLGAINQVDIITLFDVAEHMEDPLEELVNLSEHLPVGGLIYIETPRQCLADRWLSILAFFKIVRNNRVSREHLQLYSDKSLRILMSNTGFKVLVFKRKTSLSWGGHRGLSQYFTNMGLRSRPFNWMAVKAVQCLLAVGLFGRNKAIIVGEKTPPTS